MRAKKYTEDERAQMRGEAIERFLALNPGLAQCQVCSGYPGFDCRCDDDAFLNSAPFLVHEE